MAADLVERGADDMGLGGAGGVVERKNGCGGDGRRGLRRRSAVDDEIAGLDPLAGAQQDRALEDVLELAAIAGPDVDAEPGDAPRRSGRGRRRRRGRDGASIAAVMARMSAGRSRSGAQGHRHDVEPPVEVGAEAAGGDLGGEIAIGRGDDAQIDRLGADRADGQDFALLDRAQQLGLQGERDFGDLVEQQGAAVGGAEQALAVRRRRR